MTKKIRKNKSPWELKAFFYRSIRNFFDAREYIEVQTPILTSHPGAEVYLDYFQTSWQQYVGHDRRDLFLRSSPELFLKSLLLEGHEKIYEIGSCFRNGSEFGPWHHPEFTMLEFYQQGVSYEDFMKLTAELFGYLAAELNQVGCDVAELCFDFELIYKISVFDAFKQYLHIDLVDKDPDLAKKVSAKLCPSIKKTDDFETAYYKCILEVLEPVFKSKDVVLFYDFPPSQAALSEKLGGVAKRFEYYINGVEVSNAFLELSDKERNKSRMQEINDKRKILNKSHIDYDSPPLPLLQKNLPLSCGNAIGVDRLISLLTGRQSIEKYRSRNGLLPTQ